MLSGKLLQFGDEKLEFTQKVKMALRHGDNLKKLIQFVRHLYRGAATSKNQTINEIKEMMTKSHLSTAATAC